MTMRCREIDERIEAWLDGELPAAETARVEAHLARCAVCAAAADRARAVREGLRGLPSLDAPPALVARLHAIGREAAAAGAPSPSPRRPSRSGSGSGSAVRSPLRAGWPPPVGWRLPAAVALLAATVAVAVGLAVRWVPDQRPVPAARVRQLPFADPSRLTPAAWAAQAAEVEQAEREVRIALALVGRYTRRAGAEVQEELADRWAGGTVGRGLAGAPAPLARVDEQNGGGPPSA